MNQLNLTPAKIMAISIAVLSALMVANTQLTDLFGVFWTTKITSGAALLNMILGGVVAAVTGVVPQDRQIQQVAASPGGQQALVRSVLNMPGVEPLEVNKKASPELAQMAIDPAMSKISAKPSDEAAVTATAAANPS